MMTIRVEWTEVRNQEAFRISGELGEKWEFWEKSAREVRWYSLASNAELIARAEELLRHSARCFAVA